MLQHDRPRTAPSASCSACIRDATATAGLRLEALRRRSQHCADADAFRRLAQGRRNIARDERAPAPRSCCCQRSWSSSSTGIAVGLRRGCRTSPRSAATSRGAAVQRGLAAGAALQTVRRLVWAWPQARRAPHRPRGARAAPHPPRSRSSPPRSRGPRGKELPGAHRDRPEALAVGRSCFVTSRVGRRISAAAAGGDGAGPERRGSGTEAPREDGTKATEPRRAQAEAAEREGRAPHGLTGTPRRSISS